MIPNLSWNNVHMCFGLYLQVSRLVTWAVVSFSTSYPWANWDPEGGSSKAWTETVWFSSGPSTVPPATCPRGQPCWTSAMTQRGSSFHCDLHLGLRFRDDSRITGSFTCGQPNICSVKPETLVRLLPHQRGWDIWSSCLLCAAFIITSPLYREHLSPVSGVTSMLQQSSGSKKHTVHQVQKKRARVLTSFEIILEQSTHTQFGVVCLFVGFSCGQR